MLNKHTGACACITSYGGTSLIIYNFALIYLPGNHLTESRCVGVCVCVYSTEYSDGIIIGTTSLLGSGHVIYMRFLVCDQL